MIYADSDNTLADVEGTGSHAYDRVEYRYNRQGEMTAMKDQNQTVHDYAFDGAGRLLTDTATVAGGNPWDLDTAVAAIAYGYGVCGKLFSVTSKDSNGAALNQVKYQYNSDGNLQKEYQEHDGAVDTGDGNSLYVAFGYASAALGYRPATLQYPTSSSSSPGRTLTFQYGDSVDTGGVTNRVGSIYDSAEGGITVDTLAYLGANQEDQTTYSPSHGAPWQTPGPWRPSRASSRGHSSSSQAKRQALGPSRRDWT